MIFYVGLHHPADAKHFDRAFISVNAVRGRRKHVPSPEWIMDSGAFTEISRHGCYRHEPFAYAREVNRLRSLNDGLKVAVSQDFMCEDIILKKTGLSLADHQRLTIERYDMLRGFVRGVYLMPVLQGYAPATYVEHVTAYEHRLPPGAYAGVGSVCKRNGTPDAVHDVLRAIKNVRPDLKLHGFGLKLTALNDVRIRDLLHSADSMAWSFSARKQGRDANDWREAKMFEQRIVGGTQ